MAMRTSRVCEASMCWRLSTALVSSSSLAISRYCSDCSTISNAHTASAQVPALGVSFCREPPPPPFSCAIPISRTHFRRRCSFDSQKHCLLRTAPPASGLPNAYPYNRAHAAFFSGNSATAVHLAEDRLSCCRISCLPRFKHSRTLPPPIY
ncbi:hypothetical protein P171DRAFT_16989 [Karstenula rhodostoma CBS 690.94]|uniref:Uncharacterized protein n=1 Tax=Karstenula rhodostoma CBS 690.94 TaxID=1392251 RepID=A0A9P4UJB9_9PLEO|nr:hypothetical protein P171DRAFT_16989 [Karstenula rhodostoma CBS 690.94]